MYQLVDVTALNVVVTLFSEVKLVPKVTDVNIRSLNSLVPVFLRSLQFAELAFLSHVPVRLLMLSNYMWSVMFSFSFRRVKTVLAATLIKSHSSLVEEANVVVATGKL